MSAPARAMRQRGRRSPFTPTLAAPDLVGEVANATRKDIRIGISASALVCRGLWQPSHGCIGGPAHQLDKRTSGEL